MKLFCRVYFILLKISVHQNAVIEPVVFAWGDLFRTGDISAALSGFCLCHKRQAVVSLDVSLKRQVIFFILVP